MANGRERQIGSGEPHIYHVRTGCQANAANIQIIFAAATLLICCRIINQMVLLNVTKCLKRSSQILKATGEAFISDRKTKDVFAAEDEFVERANAFLLIF